MLGRWRSCTGSLTKAIGRLSRRCYLCPSNRSVHMNIVSSIWNYKCPRCRKGDLYVQPFMMSAPLSMHEKCSHCGQRFEPEPGYYFGAMFISYIRTAWTCLAIVGFCMLVLGWSVNASFALLIFVCAVSYFWVARISRAMYIHLDVRFDPAHSEEQPD